MTATALPGTTCEAGGHTDRRPLTGGVMVGYGVGGLGVSAVEFFVRVYLLKLYTDVVGLSPSIAGAVLAVAVLWDAVTDPLMGEISDRTVARSGRRRPWIVLGSILAAGGFILLFLPPALGSTATKAAFLLMAYLVFNTAVTMIAVPHAALGGELTSDPAVRNKVFGWRFLFANVGLLFGIVVPVAVAGGNGTSFSGGALWLAPVVAGVGLIAFRATKGRDAPDRSGTRLSVREFLRSLAAVLRCRPFRPLVAAYFVGSVAMTLNSAIALYYYEHRLGLGEREVFLWILMPFALVIALSIGGWVLLARLLSRRRAAFTGFVLLGLGTAVVYPLFPEGEIAGPLIWAVVGGSLLGSVFLLDATVADVVDLDEAATGVHREGVFFGFWRMAAKTARAVGLAATGVLLDLIGFEPGTGVQSASTGEGLAWLFGPGVGGLFLLAAVLYLLVPLRDRKVDRTGRKGDDTCAERQVSPA